MLSQFRPVDNEQTLADFIDNKAMRVCGRLDKDSEGLLLLTDDGALNHLITQPEHKMPKSYWAQVEGIPEQAALERLANGVELNDGPTKPALVSVVDPPVIWERSPPIRERKHIPTTWLSITIEEGRNRQVRRMTAAVGYPTLRLVRYRIGPWYLNDLQPGQSEARAVPKHILAQLKTK